MSERDEPHSETREIGDEELVALLRAISADDSQLEAPPAALWASIDAAVRAEETTAAADATAKPASAEPRRRWPGGRLVGAIAAAAVVIAAGTTLVMRRADRDTLTLATAQLSSNGLAGAPAGLRGDAEVIERNGQQFLHVSAGRLAPTSGEYLELWLIDTSVKGMVSLGIIDKGGDYELPAGLRFRDYPIVDISSEPYDGNPKHSGNSLLRGTLA